MKNATTIVLLCVLAILAACQIPEGYNDRIHQINAAYDRGEITAQERDRRIEALRGVYNATPSWEWFLCAGVSIAGAMAGVRAHRGPATQRVGLPAEKIIDAITTNDQKGTP